MRVSVFGGVSKSHVHQQPCECVAGVSEGQRRKEGMECIRYLPVALKGCGGPMGWEVTHETSCAVRGAQFTRQEANN